MAELLQQEVLVLYFLLVELVVLDEATEEIGVMGLEGVLSPFAFSDRGVDVLFYYALGEQHLLFRG